jgi:hypothetical protein
MQSVENLVRPNHGTVFPIEIRQAHRANLVRCSPHSMPVPATKSERRVFYEEGVETEVSRHPHSSLNGIVGNDTSHKQ